jgi:DNA-binding NtrC family response regulator
MQAGAFHYAGKPFDLDTVVETAERALESTRLQRHVRELVATDAPAVASIIGESAPMSSVKALALRIATSPTSTVLVTGESGTGKDLVAHAIHAHSDRRDGPFLNITCSALRETELFGHERGAYTDARSRKRGLLEHADGGTVFLDEVGEMELPLQAKLLRVLEDKTFRRVGGSADICSDVRIIAATNVDLREAVREGAFREDLYYRLAVLTVHLPPLRDRAGDVDLLASHFVARFNDQFDRSLGPLPAEVLELLRLHRWPGNVRELRNAIERAVLLAEGDTIEPDDLSFLSDAAIDAPVFRLPANGVNIRDLEKDLVIQALERTGGNQTRAAALLGMNRDQVRYRIERFDLGDLKKN